MPMDEKMSKQRDDDFVVAFMSMTKSQESAWCLLSDPVTLDSTKEVQIPFWIIRRYSLKAADSQPNLELFMLELSVHNNMTPKDPAFKSMCRTAPVKIRVPYFSNPDRIEAGTTLTCKFESAKKRKQPPNT